MRKCSCDWRTAYTCWERAAAFRRPVMHTEVPQCTGQRCDVCLMGAWGA
jgi:hypothetical protein